LETLGNRLRWARDRKLWTQRELSVRSGIMEATISRIENNKHRRRPNTETLTALAEALGVSPYWLVFGEDDEGKAAA
jgi:transcriptional regulator with XRE-family HTH domain